MKKIICLLLLLSLPQLVSADNKKKKEHSNNAPAQRAPSGGGGGGMRAPGGSHGNTGQRSGGQRNFGQGSSHSRAPRSSSPASMGAGGTNRMKAHGNGADHSSNPMMRKSGTAGATGHSNPMMKNNKNAAANGHASNPMMKNGRNANAAAGKKGGKLNGNRAALGARNGRGGIHNRAGVAGRNYRVRPYREVFHGYHRVYHDRGWYGARYDRVVIVGGGYYYWDAGYWYPAWGYDPGVAFYAYDGPIYSYDNLPPDEVIVNVQTELQDQGYYTGDVDGQLGPKTRDAVGAFQRDHDLEITSAVDEPTVEALGLSA